MNTLISLSIFPMGAGENVLKIGEIKLALQVR